MRGAAAMAGGMIPVDLAALTDGGTRAPGPAEGADFRRGARPACDPERPGHRPLGYALHDSQAGQLAWIAEKFEEWTAGPADRDALLATVSLYWLTGSGICAAPVPCSPRTRTTPNGPARPRRRSAGRCSAAPTR